MLHHQHFSRIFLILLQFAKIFLFIYIYIYIYIYTYTHTQWNLSFWTLFIPKLGLTTNLFENWNNAARVDLASHSGMFGLWAFHFHHLSLCLNSKNLLDHWGILFFFFFFLFLYWNFLVEFWIVWLELFNNRGSTAYVYIIFF